jgi:hypothetical protein
MSRFALGPTVGTRVLSQVYSSLDMKSTTHLHVVPTLRMGGALFPHCAFMAPTGKTVPLPCNLQSMNYHSDSKLRCSSGEHLIPQLTVLYHMHSVPVTAAVIFQFPSKVRNFLTSWMTGSFSRNMVWNYVTYADMHMLCICEVVILSYLMTFVQISTLCSEALGWLWMMNCKTSRLKWSWSVLRYGPGVCLAN